MAPSREWLPVEVRVCRIENSCPCKRCRSWRRRRSEIQQAMKETTGAFDLFVAFAIDDILAAIVDGMA